MNFATTLLAGFGALMASAFATIFRTAGEPMLGYLFNLISVFYFLACFYYIFVIHNARIEREKAKFFAQRTKNTKKIG